MGTFMEVRALGIQGSAGRRMSAELTGLPRGQRLPSGTEEAMGALARTKRSMKVDEANMQNHVLWMRLVSPCPLSR